MKAVVAISRRVLLFLALLVLAGQAVALAGSPSEPTTTLKSTFPVANAPQQFQVVQQVLDFPPGAWTPAHSHGGLVFVTIAKGAVTQFSDGKDTTYKVGDTWTETPGHAHQAGNTTSAPARTLVTFLLPPDAKQTTPQELAGAHASTVKTVAKVSKFDGTPAVARPFDVVEMQFDFAPGQQLPSQRYGGPAFFSVLDGELSVQDNGTQKAVKAGENWTENGGGFSTVTNQGTAPASLFVTVLLPRGAKLMTQESQARVPTTLPETGGAVSTSPLELALIPAALVAVLIAAGAYLRRRGARG